MEERPSVPMEITGKIIRRSVYTFLKNYHYFTSTAAVIVFPASVSILLSQSTLVPPFPLLSVIYLRLQSLFSVAGFPPSSQFISLLNLKLSQTLSSTILSIPFTLSFLLLAKACVIDALHHHHHHQHNKLSLQSSFSSFLFLYIPLLITHICNSFVILSANAGMENCSGFLAILKACMLIRGRASTALSLALPINLGLAFVEALFQYRIIRVYNHSDRLSPSTPLEGIFIAYLYSLFIILDIIANCMLFKSLKSSSHMDLESRNVYHEVIPGEEDCSSITYSKN
ncbi:uncharacterized protein LOC122079243 [Macadamia integrifolia]|uniref:uncharacterized protein LOC122079243 n=1 Tax=Macadamia integrifolia TaxID=60698 RepID=UPI001C4F0666|nr:uncharacterized protein LOC122079243 [Macadamia integrifolia]